MYVCGGVKKHALLIALGQLMETDTHFRGMKKRVEIQLTLLLSDF